MIINLSNNKYLIGMLIGIASVGFCAQGCKKDEPNPEPVSLVKSESDKTPKVEKLIQQQLSSSVKLSPLAPNQFDFSSKKDPFKPHLVAKKPPVPVFARSKRVSALALPIHRFDVNNYKVIGIITGIRENQAMVTDPNGKGYVIKVGMTIGKNEGRITSISQSGVTVLEQFQDDNGRVRKEYIKINLPRKQ